MKSEDYTHATMAPDIHGKRHSILHCLVPTWCDPEEESHPLSQTQKIEFSGLVQKAMVNSYPQQLITNYPYKSNYIIHQT